jgi:hypothetical protein
LDFQESLGLQQFVLPNILIQDGLASESAAIAKNFLEIGNEIAIQRKIQSQTLASLALGQSTFRNEKPWIDFVDELTGFNLEVNGFYLLSETSKEGGSNPWFTAEILQSQMYLSYALHEAGFYVLHGYSCLPAPFLAAAGSDACAMGWYDTLRYFSLDRFCPSRPGGQRPNKKYLSQKLWHRIEVAQMKNVPRLKNDCGLAPEQIDSDTSEILQHWETLSCFCKKIDALPSYTEKLRFLLAWLDETERAKSDLLFPISHFESRNRNCRSAIRAFADLAEIPLS